MRRSRGQRLVVSQLNVKPPSLGFNNFSGKEAADLGRDPQHTAWLQVQALYALGPDSSSLLTSRLDVSYARPR